VASEAHEFGPEPVQTNLDTLMRDLDNTAAWGYEPDLPDSMSRQVRIGAYRRAPSNTRVANILEVIRGEER
jgi:hypothetical protein